MTGLPTPTGKQHHVIHLPADRHHVVLGTAGTGKSLMATLRAAHLARHSTINHGPALLVTYNNALVTYLDHLRSGAAADITIRTYGRFARGYLAARGLMGYNAIAKPWQVDSYVSLAVHQVKHAGVTHSVLDRDTGWFVDEIHWISGMGITSEADYQSAARVGRQTPLSTGQARTIVWNVRDNYLKNRAASGFSNDWYDLGSSVRSAITTDATPRMYRHIIIDEGQDLSPEFLRSLTEIVQPGGSVTFFGDYHQAIYGQGLSWREAGFVLSGRPVEKFVDNYRNTAQIARVAIAMAASPFMSTGNQDLVEPTQPVADGPMPVLLRCGDTSHEASAMRDLAVDAARDQRVAILARTWDEALTVVRGLSYTNLDSGLRRWDDTPGLYVGAFHSAKGLEFDAVFMPFLNSDTLPYPNVVRAFIEDEAMSREARLLYVSVTRAKSTLVMSYSSERTPLLPSGHGLWDEATP